MAAIIIPFTTISMAYADDGPATVTNLNIPTCPFGSPRPVVVVPPDPKENGIAVVDCSTPFADPRTDVEAFLHGYITRTDDLRPPKP